MSDHALSLRLIPEPEETRSHEALVESYRRLADVFHDVLGEQSLDALLDRIADALADLIPHDSLTIYEADEPRRILIPVWARDKWADKILADRCPFGVGLTGWGVEHREAARVNQAQNDPRVATVPGTPDDEPEAMITVPLIARDSVKGALNIYRLGEDALFDDDEFELAKRFGDAAALALDNAQIRARLEHQATTDSLTGLYNHRAFHERLRKSLASASRSHEAVSVLMLDIDDFKRVNDIYGHGAGDEILRGLAETLKDSVRTSDAVYRLGGEEFAIVIASRSPENAEQLAHRVVERVTATDFDPAGRITISVGLARGPEHAMNPRELIACAEAAMMSAKARGKNQIVLYEESTMERPVGEPVPSARDVRSVAHMKMLQSLGGKLNRLNDVKQIGNVIATELRALIDYHNCRVSLVEGNDVIPIAFVGQFTSETREPMEILVCKVGEGITGRVAQTGESLLIADAANCEFARILPGTDSIDESQVVVPLTFGTRVIGVVVISKLGLNQFDEDDVRLLEVLAGHAAVALENASLYEAARREAERATTLLEFSRQVASAEGMDAVIDRIVQFSATALGSACASVWWQDAVGEDVRVRGTFGYVELDRERLARMSFPHELAAEHLTDGEPFVVTNKLRAAIAPMALEGGRLGCIAVALPEGPEFTERQLRLLAGIAHQSRLALTNAGNFDTLERTFLDTVEALANALEANDEYTSSHARWITDLSLKVGEELGLDMRSLKRLELGALFHDIGKIGIPETILSKPGPLTDEERAIVETHPELGEKIIAPIDRLEEVRPIVRHCHERYDGAGYPDRLRGDDIPIESRIILVCDAYHAMTTDRPYRRRLPDEEALRRLREAAGTQFDPRVVEVCARVLITGAAGVSPSVPLGLR
ncbi:MAG TPA: diguanylate cyclase [Gaiellaceae bacterium]|jgi:diguanylate cyclase (GGDEF)-like protein|nr:diguanylate cyclase [Gaiellaceae bacterium]